MSPGQPFIRTLAARPIAPGVTAHSIIPVRFEGPLTGQTDGIVAYESAHIEGIASERVVRLGALDPGASGDDRGGAARPPRACWRRLRPQAYGRARGDPGVRAALPGPGCSFA